MQSTVAEPNNNDDDEQTSQWNERAKQKNHDITKKALIKTVNHRKKTRLK